MTDVRTFTMKSLSLGFSLNDQKCPHITMVLVIHAGWHSKNAGHADISHSPPTVSFEYRCGNWGMGYLFCFVFCHSFSNLFL